MSISADEVKHIAGLSRLSLADEEAETFRSQLNSILGYVEQLGKLDTADIGPTSHVLPLKNVMREDRVGDSLQVEEALKNSPDGTGKFYRVPKIIE
ncbi:MAG: Asp-tRNA(Asn)/Glu-tRNA(Gln) amidotransferase subunit GatC [Nitrospirae bacterium]|nr:MAG: Asp-tRNA(Asn)/Glu-tRNA(Gln) amidotransferase subunit GatC [Nitrospirota bacterium]